MATGASTPSSRRTSSPVQRCEASERTRQPNRRERSFSGRASVDVQHCRTSEFSKCGVARIGSRLEPFVGRVANRLPPLCATSQRLAAQESTNAACIWIAGSRRSSRPWPPWEFAQDRRKSAPMPAARRASVERRHVDPDDQPLTRLALRQRLSAPPAPPPTKLPASGSGQKGRRP